MDLLLINRLLSINRVIVDIIILNNKAITINNSHNLIFLKEIITMVKIPNKINTIKIKNI